MASAFWGISGPPGNSWIRTSEDSCTTPGTSGRSRGDYRRTIVIQTANWGYQERFLAHCAARYSFKSILVPYTTDQLIINGYLLSAFDRICAQGPVETRYAVDFHRVPARKVVPLGMLWLRNIESLERRHSGSVPRHEETGRKKVLLYAGLTASFFPRASEFEAVDSVLNAIKAGMLPHSRLVYRPVILTPDDLAQVQARYGGEELVEIQTPQASCVGISVDTAERIQTEMVEYVKQVKSVDVLIMSATTTMMFDALYFDIPCIANFTDPTGTLESIGFTGAYMRNDETLQAAPGMPIAHSLEELVRYVREAIENPESHQTVKSTTFAEWDHADARYVERFMEAIREVEHERKWLIVPCDLPKVCRPRTYLGFARENGCAAAGTDPAAGRQEKNRFRPPR